MIFEKSGIFGKSKSRREEKKIDKFSLKLSWSETNLSIETVAFFKDRLFCRITRLKNEINDLNFFQSLKLSVFRCPEPKPARSIQIVFLKKTRFRCELGWREVIDAFEDRRVCSSINLEVIFFVWISGVQDSKAKNEFEINSVKFNYTGTLLVEMKTRNSVNLVWLSKPVVTTVVFGLPG